MVMKIKYEVNHKIIKNIEHKRCLICDIWFPMNSENFYKNNTSPDGFNPYCKDCTKNKSSKYQKENPEWTKEYGKKQYKRKREYFIDNALRWNKENKNKAKVLQKEWRQNNKDKLKKYNEERKHKEHEISNDELNEIYEYANYSCMYCGITEKESKDKYGQRLHKDHAINEGSNRIDNCILACKSCNTSKRTNDWNVWYTPDNPRYDEDRYIKIVNWLNKF